MASGAMLANARITQSAEPASIVCNGAATLLNVAVDSREGVRVGGSGLVKLDGCYIRAVGVGSDHADGLQAYAPGARGTIDASNSTFEIGGVATAGFFVADKWGGTVKITNCLFRGTTYGLRIHSDSGNGGISVAFKDVFFLTSQDPYITDEGGGLTITQWDNVRRATLVNGAIVPGALIPRP